MGKLHAIGKVSLRVFGRDHLPPYFHAIGPDEEVMIEIATLTVMRGAMSSKPLRAVLAWAADNQAALAAEWTRLNPRFPAT